MAAVVKEDLDAPPAIFICKDSQTTTEQATPELENVDNLQGQEDHGDQDAELEDDDDVFHSLPGLPENDSCKATVISRPLDPLAESYRVIIIIL